MKFKMVVVESLAWSAIGVALTGAVFGQSVDVGADAGTGSVDTNATADGALDNATDTANDAANTATDTANDAANTATDTANDAANRATDTANDAANTATDAASRTQGDVDVNTQGDVDVNARTGRDGSTNRLDANGQIDSSLNTGRSGRTGTDAGVNGRVNRSDSGISAGVNSGSTNRSGQGRDRIGINSGNRDRLGVTFGQNSRNGLIIDQALPNSPAARLGLRAGDRIVSINGQSFQSVDEYNSRFGEFQNLQRMPIVYERNGQRFTRDIDFSQDMGDNGSYSNGSYQNGYSGGQSYSADRPTYEMHGQQQMGYSESYGGAGCGVQAPPMQISCCGHQGGSYGYHQGVSYGHHGFDDDFDDDDDDDYGRGHRRSARRLWRD